MGLPAIRKSTELVKADEPVEGAFERYIRQIGGYPPQRPESLWRRLRQWIEFGPKWIVYVGATLIVAGVVIGGTLAVGAAMVGVGLWFHIPWISLEGTPFAWLMPHATFIDTGTRTFTLNANSRGVFVTTCKANSAAFACLIDTGATSGNSLLVMDRNSARQSGINLQNLTFNQFGITSDNVRIRAATAMISRLQIGPFVVMNAPVTVADSDHDIQLVTTEFMKNYTVTVSKGTMTITE